MDLKLATIVLHMTILLHSQWVPSLMASTRTTHGRKSTVLSLWFYGHHFWQEVTYSFNRGICEVEGLMYPKPRMKSEALTALKWL